jgi:hypothetical protein
VPGKLPAFQFYTGDWLKDPELSMCSPATRGIWADAICAMHEFDRSGSLTGTREQLSRVCRCALSDMQTAIAELDTTGAANVTERNGVVTLVNRRMQREHLERLATRNRVQRHRGNGRSPPEVTPPFFIFIFNFIFGRRGIAEGTGYPGVPPRLGRLLGVPNANKMKTLKPASVGGSSRPSQDGEWRSRGSDRHHHPAGVAGNIRAFGETRWCCRTNPTTENRSPA